MGVPKQQRSAMGDHQRSSILSNEPVWRFSNFNLGWVDCGKALEIKEKFIHQMKNSGYGQKQTRDIVICGIKGCEQEGKGFYRSAKSTLKSRTRKKLLERETWYKGERSD